MRHETAAACRPTGSSSTPRLISPHLAYIAFPSMGQVNCCSGDDRPQDVLQIPPVAPEMPAPPAAESATPEPAPEPAATEPKPAGFGVTFLNAKNEEARAKGQTAARPGKMSGFSHSLSQAKL